MWIDRQLRQLLRPKPLAIFEACSIGIVSALAAVGLKQSIVWLEAGRVDLASVFPAWIVLPPIGLVGGYLSGLLVERLAPEAAGSGIPQVKAALGYVPIALDLRVAVVKWLSTSLSIGSGFALGRQGPTVQIGAALAAQLSYWTDTSPTYQRQLIAAGAAAGLAASFHAPIAGVLFVVEELLQDVSDLTLGTAIVAAVVGGVIARALGGRGMVPDLSQIPIQFDLAEIPLLIGVGILAGWLGVLFNRSLLASLKFDLWGFRTRSLAVKVAIAGGITGMLAAIVPYALLGNTDLQDVLIIGGVNWQMAAGILVGQFVMCVVGFGATAPGGLFAPSLILGAAVGDLVATGAQSGYAAGIFPVDLVLSSPTVYALTGMSAVFSAVTHRPIVAIAIVWEMTAQFDLVLPLMIGSVSAYLVAEKLAPGSIYQHLLTRKGINLDLPDLAQRRWVGLTAADLMQRQVQTLSSQMTIGQAVQAFANSSHRGFPIVDEGKLVGILTQSDLAQLEDLQAAIATLMTRRVIALTPRDPLTLVLHLLDRYQIGRLPVVDGRKLVGIVTRGDIIRAEADRLSSTVSPFQNRPQPSYLVYQTRSPATGRGRLLVPLSNPQTADILLRLAAAIALESNYEIECLHAIVIPHASHPAETAVDLTYSRQLSDRAVALGKIWGVAVHTQVRVTHNVAATILETISDRHIDLLCMGWQGKTSTPDRIFGNTVDTAIRQAPCHVMLVKLGEQLQANESEISMLTAKSALDALARLQRLHRWLVPIAGGPNTEHALQLLPALTSLDRIPEIHLCQVFAPTGEPPDLRNLHTASAFIQENLDTVARVTPLAGDDVAHAAIEFATAQHCDAIILGASREGLLQQTIQGNIPEAIARGSDCTVIVVRAAIEDRV